jgi:hypothetical protein
VIVRKLFEQFSAIYSFRKLAEGKCGVKTPCPSRYRVGEVRAPGIRENHPSATKTEAALTAQDADDILNKDGNNSLPECPEDDR